MTWLPHCLAYHTVSFLVARLLNGIWHHFGLPQFLWPAAGSFPQKKTLSLRRFPQSEHLLRKDGSVLVAAAGRLYDAARKRGERMRSGPGVSQLLVPAAPFLDVYRAMTGELAEIRELIEQGHGPAEQFGDLIGGEHVQVVWVASHRYLDQSHVDLYVRCIADALSVTITTYDRGCGFGGTGWFPDRAGSTSTTGRRVQGGGSRQKPRSPRSPTGE